MKKFIITIDTEFDNGWGWHYGDAVTTENVNCVPRFQSLCEDYGFIPTYLAAYEMLTDRRFVDFAKQKQLDGKCEVGIHPHAWTMPPQYQLTPREDSDGFGHAYLKEYPDEIIAEKVDLLKKIYVDDFDCLPTSHRAAKWGTSQPYFEILDKAGVKYDCSVTPGYNWCNAKGFSPNSCGNDYTDFPKKPYIIENTDIREIPVTTRIDHRFILNEDGNTSVRRNIRHAIRAVKGKKWLWLRPDGKNLDDLMYIAEKTRRSSGDYLMFVLHSSEMMPGGSPTFDTEEKIEKLYSDLDVLFEKISNYYEGVSLSNFGENIK